MPNATKSRKVKSPKKLKYNNKKIEHNGLKFDSQFEYRYYLYLIRKKAHGEIKDFTTNRKHTKFQILKGYYHKGVKVRDINYVADFVITRNDDSIIIVDTKSPQTAKLQHFKDKIKLLLEQNPELDFWVVMEPQKHHFVTYLQHGSKGEWE